MVDNRLRRTSSATVPHPPGSPHGSPSSVRSGMRRARRARRRACRRCVRRDSRRRRRRSRSRSSPPTGSYVVLLEDAPAATYEGGVHGLAATMPDPGEKLDRTPQRSKKYIAFLEERQSEVAVEARGRTGGDLSDHAQRVQREDVARRRRRRSPRATGCSRSTRTRSSDPTPRPRPISSASTGRAACGRRSAEPDAAGSGVVIGVIDTGIAAENPVFRGRAAEGRQRRRAAPRRQPGRLREGGWTGVPQHPRHRRAVGQVRLLDQAHRRAVLRVGCRRRRTSTSTTTCSRRATATATAPTPRASRRATTASTPRSTASTSAPSPVSPRRRRSRRTRPASSVRTRSSPSDDICVGSDLLAAVEQAVADGVDVISYSIGGGAAASEWGADDISFYNAAVAGVFIAASAGNTGPGASTVGQRGAPWYTTVAASTIPAFEATVELSTGFQAAGVSVSVPSGAPVSAPRRLRGRRGARRSRRCPPLLPRHARPCAGSPAGSWSAIAARTRAPRSRRRWRMPAASA